MRLKQLIAYHDSELHNCKKAISSWKQPWEHPYIEVTPEEKQQHIEAWECKASIHQEAIDLLEDLGIEPGRCREQR